VKLILIFQFLDCLLDLLYLKKPYFYENLNKNNAMSLLRYALIITILVCISCQEKKSELKVLDGLIREMIAATPGTYAVAFQDLSDSSNYLFINEKEVFHAASTMKTPVLYELYKQENQGLLDMDDSIKIKNDFYSIVDGSAYTMDINVDSGEKFYNQIGELATVYDLAFEMITKSSNLATNILIEKVDAKKVTASMHDLGADSILVLRGVEDLKAFEAGLSNRTNALDLLILFRELGKYALVDSSASQKMIDILLDQKYNEIIPAKLPAEVKVAHKTGSITRVMHDSGLIILPDGRKYVLVLLSKEWEDEDQVREMLADISRKIYDYLNGSPKPN